MGKVSLLVCDHCDCRNMCDSLQVHGIELLQVTINFLDRKTEMPFASVYLCTECREGLNTAVVNCITQLPRAAP